VPNLILAQTEKPVFDQMHLELDKLKFQFFAGRSAADQLSWKLKIQFLYPPRGVFLETEITVFEHLKNSFFTSRKLSKNDVQEISFFFGQFQEIST